MKTWWKQAECRDMSLALFFPFPGDTRTRDEALAVCAECPVTDECRDYAVLLGTSDGIWGGEDFALRRFRRVQIPEPAEAVTG